MKMIKTDRKDLMKDPSSGAVINTNKSALDSYKLRKIQQKRIDSMAREIDIIKSSLDDIVELLKNR